MDARTQTVEALQEEEGVEALEAFEYHDNRKLCEMAVALIEKYFYQEDEVCVHTLLATFETYTRCCYSVCQHIVLARTGLLNSGLSTAAHVVTLDRIISCGSTVSVVHIGVCPYKACLLAPARTLGISGPCTYLGSSCSSVYWVFCYSFSTK